MALETFVSAGPGVPGCVRCRSQAGLEVKARQGHAGHLLPSGTGLLMFGCAVAAQISRPRQLRQPGRVSVHRLAEASDATLESALGLDYSKLESLLKEEDFKAADAETRRLLIQMCGKEAEKRGWIYFTEVKTIPEEDMRTLETLWQQHSQGKFGFCQQRKAWKQVRGQFDKFAEQVSWFTDTWKNRNWPDEFIYTLEAPVGHLPLTNCIRGAQVLEELLSHPAIENMKVTKVKKAAAASASTASEQGVGEAWPAIRTFNAVGSRHPGANVGAVGHMPGAVPGRARSPPGPVPGMSGVMRSHGPMSPSSQNGARPAYGSNTPTLVGSQRSMVQPQPTPVRSEGARDPREREAVQSVQASRASSVEGGHFRTPSQESHRSSKGPSRVSGSYGAPTHGSLGLQMGPGGPPRSRDESRAAFSSRSPSADSGLHKMQNNLQQSRQQMQEVEQTIAAMKGALESSKDMLKSLKGPAIEQPPLGELPAFDGGYENVLQRLQQHLRDQQAQQHELLTQLTARWEARFTALEQALSSSLEVATVATTSMNERLRRILSLGEVLEGAVERAGA
ncbi:unnamed protein product [Effrenium voratum]|uniref:GUN4-like domain-containing protein n=1 Tax=Effrenium voratum TaxID=2562239 RepID=A0AA36J120_9DINO|nr:unnamed protein product [Effrenium voratum]